jgi:thioredoxin-like negative regulator of GroEL
MSKPDTFTPEELRQWVAALTPEERREAARQEAERVESERLEAEHAKAARLAVARRAEEDRAATYAAQIASAMATLHTQAMGILNIKSLVPVVLDIGSSNYNR